MAIGISEEHDDLRRVVRRFADRHCGPSVPRAALDADTEVLPAFWPALAAPGWLGIHVPTDRGGAGYGLPELAVVLEELGRAGAPGPFLPCVVAVGALARDADATATELVRSIVATERVATVTRAPGLRGVPTDGGVAVSGEVGSVLCGAVADLLVAPVDVGGNRVWYALSLDTATRSERKSLDPTRRVATIGFDAVRVPTANALPALTDAVVERLLVVALSSEASGIAQWCIDTASEYAKQRVQFGRPIGQFQAVKHRCAEMLARAELARAAAWDAARAWDDDDNGAEVAFASAAALASDVREIAKDCVQTLGGIGFTWEHDAHIYLRRAAVTHELLGRAVDWDRRAARVALGGTRRKLDVELPPEADRFRDEVRDVIERLDGIADPREQRRVLADEGYVAPSWPRPWGRDAGALEQLVIEEEFRRAKKRRPNLSIAAWALPTIIVYGSAQQQERWVRPSLRGDLSWCQLFSEPGAGSDLASLSTRATRDDGGWIVNGQKVWTTMATEADWGILLARTDPDKPKHDGITCFMLDMRTSGIDVRPLRELTGLAMFNEVFFDDVFVPDDCVVGEVNDGWRAARTTLANERVYMGGGATIAGGIVGIMRMMQARRLDADPDRLAELGDMIVRSHAHGVLGFRLTLQALFGADPSGSEAAVRKLLGTRHDQRIGEIGLDLFADEALVDEGDAAAWVYQFLFNQALTIAGGTSDIQRNVIAERLLGLPRDA